MLFFIHISLEVSYTPFTLNAVASIKMLPQIVHNCHLIHSILHCSPYLTVNWINIRAIQRPQVRRNELQSFTLQYVDCLMCTVCWRIVSLEENVPQGSVAAVPGSSAGKSVIVVLQINSVYRNHREIKKLSCRRETVSLNILLSHSRTLKVIRNDIVE